jgi:hypothetical protein
MHQLGDVILIPQVVQFRSGLGSAVHDPSESLARRSSRSRLRRRSPRESAPLRAARLSASHSLPGIAGFFARLSHVSGIWIGVEEVRVDLKRDQVQRLEGALCASVRVRNEFGASP